MSIAESPAVSSAPQDGVQTRADNDLPVNADTDRYAMLWQSLVDGTLIEWGLLAEQPSDDCITPPTRGVISKAASVARSYKDRPSPDRVVPDGEGGIVFEIRFNTGVEVLHIWDDESVEYYRLENGRITDRYPVDV